MMIKRPCLLDSDQLSLLEDSKSPHIAHIRGLLVKLHSQLSGWGIRLQFKEEQESSKKSRTSMIKQVIFNTLSYAHSHRYQFCWGTTLNVFVMFFKVVEVKMVHVSPSQLIVISCIETLKNLNLANFVQPSTVSLYKLFQPAFWHNISLFVDCTKKNYFTAS